MVNTIWSGFDYLTYYLSTTVSLFLFVSRGDILIAKTDPPLLSVPLSLLARIKGAKFVNWLQDLYPEVALKLGFGTESGIMPKFLMHLRNRSLWRAHLNIAIGNRMAEYLKSLRVPSDRIQVVHNFADDLMISRSNEHSLELREQWGINESDFVVGYSGNLGRAHDLTTILDAAEMLSDIEEIKFVFIGGGFGHKQLLREIKARKLLNVSVKPYQARSRLNESLALPNLHWASLLPELEGFIVPSKIYGIAAAGRPLLMVGDPDGEVGRMLTKTPFGKCIITGGAKQAKDFILQAKQNSERTELMGRNARRFIDDFASRHCAVSQWKQIISQLSAKS